MISNSPVTEKIYRLPEQEPIVLNTWKSVTIPMSYFTNQGFNPVTWFQYKFDVLAATAGTVYFDNIYFTSAALSNESFQNSKVSMYPNPSSTSLNFQSKQAIETVSIYNALGQKMLEKNIDNTFFTVDISELNAGQYFVTLVSQNEKNTKIFIKK